MINRENLKGLMAITAVALTFVLIYLKQSDRPPETHYELAKAPCGNDQYQGRPVTQVEPRVVCAGNSIPPVPL